MFASSIVVILGAGGIGRALIRLFEPFGAEMQVVNCSGRCIAEENVACSKAGEPPIEVVELNLATETLHG